MVCLCSLSATAKKRRPAEEAKETMIGRLSSTGRGCPPQPGPVAQTDKKNNKVRHK